MSDLQSDLQPFCQMNWAPVFVNAAVLFQPVLVWLKSWSPQQHAVIFISILKANALFFLLIVQTLVLSSLKIA